MSVLHEISGCGNPERIADIIFIHGLDGDAFVSWKANNSDANYWPRWLGNDLPQVGVWSLDYDVSSLKWRGHAMPLTDRAANLLPLLQAKHIGERPIIFIAHSMGGLVVKALLRKARDINAPEYERIVKQTKGIVFLATPHNGSDVATWLGTIGRFLTALRVSVAIKDLVAHGPALRELSEWFQDNFDRLGIQIIVLYETRDTRGLRIVNETSANPGIQNIRRIPVDDDHVTIAKPTSRDSQSYQVSTQFVKDCLAAIVSDGSTLSIIPSYPIVESTVVSIDEPDVQIELAEFSSYLSDTIWTYSQVFGLHEESHARMLIKSVVKRLESIGWHAEKTDIIRYAGLELVSNAFHYGKPSSGIGTVIVRVFISWSEVGVTVSDQGKGFVLEVATKNTASRDIYSPLHALAAIHRMVPALKQWYTKGYCHVYFRVFKDK